MAIVKKNTKNAARKQALMDHIVAEKPKKRTVKKTTVSKHGVGAKSVKLNIQAVGRAKRKTQCEPLPNIITDVKTLTQGFDKPAAPQPHMVLAKNHAGFWEVRAYDPSADYQQIFALTLHERKAQVRAEQIIPPDRFTFRCAGDNPATVYYMDRVGPNKWSMTFSKPGGLTGCDEFSYTSVQQGLAGGWEVLTVNLQGLPGQFYVESTELFGVMKLTQMGACWGAFEGVYNGKDISRHVRSDVRTMLATGLWSYISKERYDQHIASLPLQVLPSTPDDANPRTEVGIHPSWKKNADPIQTEPSVMEDMGKADQTEADPQDAVRHPKHYNEHPSGVEAIDILQHFNFNVGNAIKYLWRMGLKSSGTDADIKELRKAREYIDFEIARKQKFPNKG